MALFDDETRTGADLKRQARSQTVQRTPPRSRDKPDHPWLPKGGHAFRPTRMARPPDRLAALWCDHAACGLAGRAPDLSALGQTSQGLARLVLAILAVAGLLAMLAPVTTAMLAGYVASLMFAALIALRLGALLVRPRWLSPPRIADADLPSVCVMVALYDEAVVVPQLAAALAAINYPADRVSFKLVLEADDRDTIHVARSLQLDDRFQIITVPPGEPRTKPRALNYALRQCRSELVAVHDAEDRPHPDQLRRAAEAFRASDPALACIQAPLNWYNRDETWLTRQFALEYAAHFHALLPLYQRLGWPLPLGGTSNHFRRDALVGVGGWDAWNVTEDADLGLRLHAAGYRCGLIEPMTLEEAPLRLEPWIKQRTRWIKGHAQTLAVLAARKNTPWQCLLPAALILGGAAVSALVHGPLSLLCLAVLLMTYGDAPASFVTPLFMLAGYGSAIACAGVAMRRAGLAHRGSDLAGMPVCWLLQTLAAVRALRQLLFDPHRWEKTEHGLSAMTGSSCTSHSLQRSSALRHASPSSSSPAGAPANQCAPNAAPASSPGP